MQTLFHFKLHHVPTANTSTHQSQHFIFMWANSSLWPDPLKKKKASTTAYWRISMVDCYDLQQRQRADFEETANDEPTLLGVTRCLGNWPMLSIPDSFQSSFTHVLQRYSVSGVCVPRQLWNSSMLHKNTLLETFFHFKYQICLVAVYYLSI